MATQQEVLQIVQQVTGADEVARLVAEEKRLKDALEAVIAPLQGMDAATIAQNANVQRAASALSANSAALQAAQRDFARTGAGARAAAAKFQQFGYILDDAMYVGTQGIRPLVNNLMFMDARLGIVALAVDTVARNWSNLSSLWGQGETKSEAARMEELGKQTHKTAEEQARYNAYLKEKKAIEASAGPSKAQAQSATDIASVVKEAAEGERTGQQVLAQQIVTARAKRNPDGFLNPEDKQKLHDIRQEELRPDLSMVAQAKAMAAGQTPEQYFEAKRKAVRDAAEQREIKQAEADIAPTNKAGRERMAATLRGIGREDLAKQVEAADPEAIKKKQQEEALAKVNAERLKEQQERDEREAAGHNAENEKRRQARKQILDKNIDKAAGGMSEGIEKQILDNEAKDPHRTDKLDMGDLKVKLAKQIEGSLRDAAFPEDQVEAMGPAILDKIMRGFFDKVRDTDFKAGGVGVPQAMKLMMTERQNKAAQEQIQAQDRAAQTARQRVPNLDHDVEVELQRGVMMGGKAPEVGKKVTDRLQAVLKQRGLNDEDAALAARKMVFDAGDRIGAQQRAQQAAMTGGAFGTGGVTYMTRQQRQLQLQMQASDKRQAAINTRRFAATNAAAQRRFKNTFVAVQPPKVTEGAAFTSGLEKVSASSDALKKALDANTRSNQELLQRGIKATATLG